MRSKTAAVFIYLLSATFGSSLYAKDVGLTWKAPLTKINGKSPKGEVLPLEDTVKMLDVIDANGLRLLVTKGVRKAGTRVGIHVHKYGGHTCVLSGEITDFVEGSKPSVYPAGTCYYMPPNTPMSAANLTDKDAVLIDTFNLPPGEEAITILEPAKK